MREAEEVKEEVKTEKKVETPAKDKPVEDACSKDAEIKKEESKKEEEVVEDEKEKDLRRLYVHETLYGLMENVSDKCREVCRFLQNIALKNL